LKTQKPFSIKSRNKITLFLSSGYTPSFASDLAEYDKNLVLSSGHPEAKISGTLRAFFEIQLIALNSIKQQKSIFTESY